MKMWKYTWLDLWKPITKQDDIIDIGNKDDLAISSLKAYLTNLYLKPKMEIYLRQTLIVPTRVHDLMHERRKFILPQQKFRSIAKTKIAMLNDQKKKLEQKLRKAKGAVSFFSSFVRIIRARSSLTY